MANEKKVNNILKTYIGGWIGAFIGYFLFVLFLYFIAGGAAAIYGGSSPTFLKILAFTWSFEDGAIFLSLGLMITGFIIGSMIQVLIRKLKK